MIKFITTTAEVTEVTKTTEGTKSGYIYSTDKNLPPTKVKILFANGVASVYNAETNALITVWNTSENKFVYESFKDADMALRAELYLNYEESARILTENCSEEVYKFICGLSQNESNKEQKIKCFISGYENKCKSFFAKAEEGKKKYAELMKHSNKKKKCLPF